MSNFNNEVNEMYLTTMNKNQCEKVHEAALQILKKTGVIYQCQEALDIFKKAGAKVDGDKVFLTPSLIEWALKAVPNTFRLYDQEGNFKYNIGNRECIYGSGSDCLNIIDHRTGLRRDPVLKDLEELVTICDSLPNIDFLMSMVIPTDCPGDMTERYQMNVMLNNSKKPIVGVSFSAEGSSDIIEMCELVAGGEANLREKPFMVHYIQPVRAMFHNEDTVLKLLQVIRKGIPCVYLVSGMMGAVNPITSAGYLAMGSAGQLSAIVLAQLVREGTPIIVRGGRIVVMDMKTMLSTFADPSNRIFAAEMAHFYNIPSFGTAGVSDSKALDWQAIAEISMTLMADSLAGANLIHDIGYVEAGVTYSAEMLVLCNEIISWIKAFKKGAPVNQETIPMELIHNLGINGNFFTTDHTLKHFKEQWEPELFDKNNQPRWKELGSHDTKYRINKKLEKILSEHKRRELPKELKQKLTEICYRNRK